MPSVLSKGAHGDEVIVLQKQLAKAGFVLKVDGDFGKLTEDKVKEFQMAKGLSPVDGVVGSATWGALLGKDGQSVLLPVGLTGEAVVAQFKNLGHVIHEDEYVLNLFGIRSKERTANSFDDILGCFVMIGGQWNFLWWPGTTDPGSYWLLNPSKVSGTSILVEGQYSAWKIDKHQGEYEALCQRAAEVKVYRDADKDEILEMDPKSITKGFFGINIHRSSQTGESKKVEKWSAGCQVHAKLDCFNTMMAMAHQQVAKTGKDVFTYTLLNSWL